MYLCICNISQKNNTTMTIIETVKQTLKLQRWPFICSIYGSRRVRMDRMALYYISLALSTTFTSQGRTFLFSSFYLSLAAVLKVECATRQKTWVSSCLKLLASCRGVCYSFDLRIYAEKVVRRNLSCSYDRSSYKLQ